MREARAALAFAAVLLYGAALVVWDVVRGRFSCRRL